MKFKRMKDKHHPLKVELKPGPYEWCTCGATKRVPWCDGTCKGDEPLRFKIAVKKTVKICNCGVTKKPPYCDESCKKLKKK